jgi:ubiquinone/menaquinone biosynthesis C-methylase UbiE
MQKTQAITNASPQSCAGARERELEYHDALYSGFAQQHFSRPAVVDFRRHLVGRILRKTGAGKSSRILSIGCGIGDTELLLAPHVGEILGIDLSPKAIMTACDGARRHRIQNVTFRVAPWESLNDLHPTFDVVLSIFFLHHLPDSELRCIPDGVRRVLRAGGLFYAVEPSANRLSGVVGKLLIPHLMKKYQTPDERPLVPRAVARQFEESQFRVRTGWYDFCSTPLAGILPGWRSTYRLARIADDLLISVPGIRAFSSNFELIAMMKSGCGPFAFS